MYSIAHPDMFSSARTNIVKDKSATYSNLKLVLLSAKKSLLGDPYFGSNLKKFIYEQNNIILRDIIIDDIYTTILEFMPQIFIERKDITLRIVNSAVEVSISCINKLDNEVNMFNISLATSEDF